MEITTAWELERFGLGTVRISNADYIVLTGHEGTGGCFWCGRELRGKLKRYCRGHMKEYYAHFMWNSARNRCCERQDGRCANCGIKHDYSLEVHHIVPLRGEKRDFSHFNLPFNLIGFCHQCHLAVHVAMKPVPPTIWERAVTKGQLVMEGITND